MPLAASDIKFYLTAGVSDPDLSLGGAVNAVTQMSASANDYFNAVTPEEATAGSIKYRAVDIKNTHATDTLFQAYLYVDSETSSADSTVALGYDTTTQTIADEDTAPAAVSFSTPLSKATGISLGDIAAGATKRVWLRRTITAGAGKTAADTGTLAVEGGVNG